MRSTIFHKKRRYIIVSSLFISFNCRHFPLSHHKFQLRQRLLMAELNRSIAQPHHRGHFSHRLTVIVHQHDDILQFFRQLIQCRCKLAQRLLAQQMFIYLFITGQVLIRFFCRPRLPEIVNDRIPRDREDPGADACLALIKGVPLPECLLEHVCAKVFSVCPALHPGCNIPHHFSAVQIIYFLPFRSVHLYLYRTDSFSSWLCLARPPLPPYQPRHRPASVHGCFCSVRALCRSRSEDLRSVRTFGSQTMLSVSSPNSCSSFLLHTSLVCYSELHNVTTVSFMYLYECF